MSRLLGKMGLAKITGNLPVADLDYIYMCLVKYYSYISQIYIFD